MRVRIILITLIILFALYHERAHPTLPSRPIEQLDPQGQDKNFGPEKCVPPRMKIYACDASSEHCFYLECARENRNE
jgi:hypothetical protein